MSSLVGSSPHADASPYSLPVHAAFALIILCCIQCHAQQNTWLPVKWLHQLRQGMWPCIFVLQLVMTHKVFNACITMQLCILVIRGAVMWVLRQLSVWLVLWTCVEVSTTSHWSKLISPRLGNIAFLGRAPQHVLVFLLMMWLQSCTALKKKLTA